MSWSDFTVPLDDNAATLDTMQPEQAAMFNISQSIRFLGEAIRRDLAELDERLERIERAARIPR